MDELKPCPFCGCNMQIVTGKYPNGDRKIEPYGWHDSDCPLKGVGWRTWPEDGWTEKNLTERWNRRVSQ